MFRFRKVCLAIAMVHLASYSVGEVLPQFKASAYGQLEDGETSLGLSTDSSVEWNYTARNLTANSSLSLDYSATTDSSDAASATWQSDNNLQYRLTPLQLDALAGYSHSENAQLLDTDDVTTDQISLGLRKYLTQTARITRSISAEYQYTWQQTDAENSESDSVSVVYNANRRLQSNASLYNSLEYSDYLNSTYSVAATVGFIKPMRRTVFTAEAGANYAESEDNDSVAYTGSLNWTIDASERLQYWFNASKYRTQASGLSGSEIYDSDYDADELVDVESLSAGLTWVVLSNRLTMDLSYNYSWLEETFDVSDGDTETTETDYGLLSLNYQMSRYSQLTVATAFSINEDEVGLIGDIEYDRALNRNFSLFAAINDISSAEESIKYIAGITYRAPGAN